MWRPLVHVRDAADAILAAATPLAGATAAPDPEREVDMAELRREVEQALADIPEQERQVLMGGTLDTALLELEILPEEEKLEVNFKDMKAELTTIYHLLQLMIKQSGDEIKMIDEHLTYLQALIVKFRGRREALENELIRVEERKKRKHKKQ